MGSTLEEITRKTRGLKQRGQPSPDGHHVPFSRKTGEGFVAERPGDYSDADSKKNPLVLVSCESTGAMNSEGASKIGHLARLANTPGHRDGTQYGTNRRSPRSFAPHHMAQISASIVYADSETLIAHADGTMGA